MAERRGIFQIFFGDPLLAGSVGLLAALGDEDGFPQDRAGIEALIGRLPEKLDGTTVTAAYEEPDALPTYRGAYSLWVGPGGAGRLRLRQRTLGWGRELGSEVFLLGPDGSFSDPKTIEGYGVPDEELTDAARAELATFERQRQEALAREPERLRQEERRRTRFLAPHLREVVAGAAGQDPTGPVLSYVAVYDDGLVVAYLVPGTVAPEPTRERPFAPEQESPEVTVDDGRGTEFRSTSGLIDPSGLVRRGRRRIFPAPAPDATRLRIEIGTAVTEIELGSA